MTDGIPIDAGAVLEKCAQVESAMATIYRAFAAAHANSPLVVSLWRKTADEEDAHERQIRFVMRGFDESKNVVLVSRDRADKALSAAQAVLSAVRKNPPPPAAAVKMALDLEELFKDFHAENATLNTDRTFNALFEALRTGDDHHLGALKVALAALEGGHAR